MKQYIILQDTQGDGLQAFPNLELDPIEEKDLLDVGCDGFTLSVWSSPSEVSRKEQRDNYICMSKEEALSVADAIYKFFKKQ
jgi:hypothetical protein